MRHVATSGRRFCQSRAITAEETEQKLEIWLSGVSAHLQREALLVGDVTIRPQYRRFNFNQGMSGSLIAYLSLVVSELNMTEKITGY